MSHSDASEVQMSYPKHLFEFGLNGCHICVELLMKGGVGMRTNQRGGGEEGGGGNRLCTHLPAYVVRWVVSKGLARGSEELLCECGWFLWKEEA